MLDFQSRKFLTPRLVCRVKMYYHAKFRQNRSNGWGDMAIFDFSRLRPSFILIFKFGNFNGWLAVVVPDASLCQIFIKIGQMVAAIWWLFDFSKWLLSTILDFQNCKLLTPIWCVVPRCITQNLAYSKSTFLRFGGWLKRSLCHFVGVEASGLQRGAGKILPVIGL